MAISTEINQVQFIAEDFSTYQTMARNFYQQYYPTKFNDVMNTDLGNALIDQLGFALMCLSFTINRRASENFMKTALLTKSITKLAKMLGYPISPAFPGTTDVTFKLTGAPYAFPIPIETGHQFQGPGSVVYEYRGTATIIIPAGQSSVTLPASEGISRILTYSSDGSQNQSFQVAGIPDGQYLYDDILAVTVDGVTWEHLSLLRYESSNIFEVLFTEVPPVLNFGDGIVGNIPPQGSQIVLSFSYGYGLTGAIGSNQLSPLTQLTVLGQDIPYTVTNTIGNVGGNPEDIRHVKAFSSSFFRTQNAAVIKSDYDTIAQLQNGVAVADAQIIRGVSGDLTIQANFNTVYSGVADMEQAAALLIASTVSGITSLGVSGTSMLFVGGIENLGVSGTNALAVSGIDQLGWDGSSVTGIGSLGVSGIQGVGISGTEQLFVGGEQYLGVSGIDKLGVTGHDQIDYLVSSGTALINTGLSGLYSYLSQVFSDTSKANNVQVIILGVDANNSYISPSLTLIDTVQQKLQSIADAVVTVTVVDGSPNIVRPDIVLDIGISPTADENTVRAEIATALSSTTDPFGLMVRRLVGLSLYKSDFNTALNSLLPKTGSGDVVFIDPVINSVPELLDMDGNLVIGKQQVIQPNSIQVNVVKRFKRTEVFTGNT